MGHHLLYLTRNICVSQSKHAHLHKYAVKHTLVAPGCGYGDGSENEASPASQLTSHQGCYAEEKKKTRENVGRCKTVRKKLTCLDQMAFFRSGSLALLGSSMLLLLLEPERCTVGVLVFSSLGLLLASGQTLCKKEKKRKNIDSNPGLPRQVLSLFTVFNFILVDFEMNNIDILPTVTYICPSSMILSSCVA